jgi:hypothetical protein
MMAKSRRPHNTEAPNLAPSSHESCSVTRLGLSYTPQLELGTEGSELLSFLANISFSSEVGHWFSRPLLQFRSRPGHSDGFPAHRPETSGPRNVSQPPQRPPFKPCMRFSGTRLSDIVHRRACAVPYLTFPESV